MPTLGIRETGSRTVERAAGGGSTLPGFLLICGILASLLYAGMIAFVAMRWEEYSPAGQTVSELSAIGAPTRSLWVALSPAYALLYAAFGWGVWRSAGRSRALRIAGALLIAQALVGIFWPPMHLRGTTTTLTDTLHVVFAMAWLLLMLLVMGFSAAALGKRFRLFTLATVAVFIVFGTLTSLDGPRVAANLPTQWIGVWERINIGAAYLWVVVLATSLLRAPGHRAVEAPATGGEAPAKGGHP